VAAVDPITVLQSAILQFTRNSRKQVAYTTIGGSFVAAAVLSYIANTQDPTATSLAEAYGLDKSTVSRQLAELEAQGLVRRSRHPSRPRTQDLHVTAKGKRALVTAVEKHRLALKQTLAKWSAKDVAAFGTLLARYVEATDPS